MQRCPKNLDNTTLMFEKENLLQAASSPEKNKKSYSISMMRNNIKVKH